MFGRILPALVALGLSGAAVVMAGDPSGNPTIKPELNEIVPVGKAYTIKWNPTTAGTISLHLLRGPTSNVVKIATIAEKIPNSGSYSWTPPASLEDDTSRYGINLTVDDSPLFQYTPQFGISNPGLRQANLSAGSAAGTTSSSTSTVSAPGTTTTSSTVTSETSASSSGSSSTPAASSASQSSASAKSSSSSSSSSAAASATKNAAAGMGVTGGVAFLGFAGSLLALSG